MSFLDEPAAEPAAWSSWRRWAVLGSFAFFSFTNAFILMDFADDYDLAELVLGLDPSADASSAKVAFLYTLFLLCVMPAMMFASWGVVHHNYATMLIGQSLNVGGTWLRYVAAQRQSYGLAVLSTVLAGASAAAIVCSYAVISERWFRPSQRGLATTIAVQSNYAGWALGSLLGLVAHHDTVYYSDTVLLYQAIVVSLCIPLFLLGYRGAPPADAERIGSATGAPVAAAAIAVAAIAADDVTLIGGGRNGGGHHGSSCEPRATLTVRESARSLCSNGRYWVYACAYAIVGGIGFAVPSAQDVIFGTTCFNSSAYRPGYGGGYDTPHTTFTNLSFILAGVLAGLLLGACVKTARGYETGVLYLSLLGSLSISALAGLSTEAVAASIPHDTLYILLIVFMALSGISTVGFIGLALNYIVVLGGGVPEAYSVGGVEWLIQGVGGGLSTASAICAVGFYACVGLSWLATLLLLVAHCYYGRAGGEGRP